MKKFAIRYGLGGGFGGLRMTPEINEFESQDEAEKYAWEMAVQEYESYGGMHGLTTMEEVMEDRGITDEEEGWEAYLEDIESWLCYEAVELKD